MAGRDLVHEALRRTLVQIGGCVYDSNGGVAGAPESPVGGTRGRGGLGDRSGMPDIYAFEQCPFRDMAHAVADRSSIVRHTARALWPSARRAERVEISEEGIAAWTLVGETHLAWDEVTAIG